MRALIFVISLFFFISVAAADDSDIFRIDPASIPDFAQCLYDIELSNDHLREVLTTNHWQAAKIERLLKQARALKLKLKKKR